jgi:uncharacterized protein (TIGR03545 family)
MKMIRWSGLVAFLVIVGLIAAFNLLFLDGIIERIVEDRASLAVGARVEIGKLRFSLLSLNAEIRGLEVANPDEPMRNTVEVGALGFDLAALPLLRKRIVIQRMEVTDLAWNTPRKTSGVLPPRLLRKLEREKGPSEAGAKAEERLEDCVLPDLSIIEDLKKGVPQDILAKVDLPSSAFLTSYRQNLSDAQRSWEERLANLPSREEIETQVAALRGLSGKRPKDVTQLPAYLNEVRDLQQRLGGLTRSLTTAQGDFQKEMAALKAPLKGVADLKAKDFNALWAQLGIRVPSAEDLICVLLGKNMAHKVNRSLDWYRKFKRFIHVARPGGGDEEPKAEPKPRLKGADVRFPVIHGYPRFLIQEATFSARPGVTGGADQITFSSLAGELQGLTTDPPIYGKPTIIRLEGNLAGRTTGSVVLSGELDHRRVPGADLLNLVIKGLRLDRTGEQGSAEEALRLKSAVLNVNGRLQVQGEALDGQILMGVREPRVEVGSGASLLANAFKNLGSFDVTLSIAGTLDEPVMGLTSPAIGGLSTALQNTLKAELSGTRESLKKVIDARVDGEVLQANQETDRFETQILGELSSRLKMAAVVPQGAQKEKQSLEKAKKGILPW